MPFNPISPFKGVRCEGRRVGLFSMLLALVLFPQHLLGDDVFLKNGLRLSGTAFRIGGMNNATNKSNNSGPVPSSAFWQIDDGVRRYFVHRTGVLKNEESADLGTIVSFKMKQERVGRGAGFSSVGSFGNVGQFDEFGRRTVTLNTQKGLVPVIQALTEIRPDRCTLVSLNYSWEYQLDTRSIPPDVLTSMIEKCSDRSDPAERKAAVQFYIQAELYEQAQEELRQILEQFPDLKTWGEESQRRLEELIARRAIGEIERRQQAGQHQLAMFFAQKFPPGMVSAEVAQRVEDVLEGYQQALKDRDRVIVLLDLLQAELPAEQAQRLTSLRATLQEELQYELMGRLEPFLRAADDETLPADQKLALAYSGWLLGNDQAVVHLDEAIRLWDVRFQVLEYLRTDRNPLRDEEILKTLNGAESLNVPRLATLIRHLPLPFEPAVTQPGIITEVEVPEEGNLPAAKYSMLLPPEYSPAHRFPVLVVMRSERSSCESSIRLWAGDEQRPGWTQRKGYIVIAPHYCADDATEHRPGTVDHQKVLRSIDHLRKRYRVDSDRLFLTGHGMGADASFDLAMSNPGVFAGIIPINGLGGPIANAYRRNGPGDAWYIISGERDRNLRDGNAWFLNDMMRLGYNVLCCEYQSRGFESYAEEQERLFDWMNLQRRAPLQKIAEFEAGAVRRADHRYYWVEAGGISEQSFPPFEWDTPKPRAPAFRTFKGRVTAGSPDVGCRIVLTHPGAATTLWLNPEFFNFDYRCEVSVNSKSVFRDYVKPSLEAMLTDLRRRGDRERLYWARLDL